jgi:hypothetical protein
VFLDKACSVMLDRGTICTAASASAAAASSGGGGSGSAEGQHSLKLHMCENRLQPFASGTHVPIMGFLNYRGLAAC